MSVLPMLPAVVDRRERPLRELRISVTDRCNFRCGYCMPKNVFGAAHRFLPKSEILSFEEIARLSAIFVRLGVGKIRLTGGEPLLRSELPKLVRMLSALDVDLALTTNGSRLEALAADLKDAGLGRVTVSLDSLDPDVFRRMADTDVSVATVLAGIEAARRAGFEPLKINAVVRRGENDRTIADLARRFKGTGVVVRFIEYMDVGTSNGWRPSDVVPAREILERIDRETPLEPAMPDDHAAVARGYRYKDGTGEIGVIASVTEPFCGTCTRARLSAEGRFYTCLFATRGVDLRGLVRGGATDTEIARVIETTWRAREDRYSELRPVARPADSLRIEMSYIGG